MTSWLLAAGAILPVVWAWLRWADHVLLNLTVWRVGVFIALTIAGFIGTYILGKTLMRAVQWRDTLILTAIGLASSALGWAVATLHLGLFDRMFLRQGSLDAFRTR